MTLRAELVEAGPLDRAVWDLGGRHWLESRLRVTLERLRAEYGLRPRSPWGWSNGTNPIWAPSDGSKPDCSSSHQPLDRVRAIA